MGTLYECLDRVIANLFQYHQFMNSRVMNLVFPSFDHYGIWLSVNDDLNRRSKNYFKFMGPWLYHLDFPYRVRNVWHFSMPQDQNIEALTVTLKMWNNDTFGNIFQKKEKILVRLEEVNKEIFINPNNNVLQLRQKLWINYTKILKHQEAYRF